MVMVALLGENCFKDEGSGISLVGLSFHHFVVDGTIVS